MTNCKRLYRSCFLLIGSFMFSSPLLSFADEGIPNAMKEKQKEEQLAHMDDKQTKATYYAYYPQQHDDAIIAAQNHAKQQLDIQKQALLKAQAQHAQECQEKYTLSSKAEAAIKALQSAPPTLKNQGELASYKEAYEKLRKESVSGYCAGHVYMANGKSAPEPHELATTKPPTTPKPAT